jgi:hypothetical protein
MVGKGAITLKHRLEATRVTADAGAEMVVPHSLGLTRKTTTVQATAQSLPISVLDLVPTRPGEAAGRAIARSVGAYNLKSESERQGNMDHYRPADKPANQESQQVSDSGEPKRRAPGAFAWMQKGFIAKVMNDTNAFWREGSLFRLMSNPPVVDP